MDARKARFLKLTACLALLAAVPAGLALHLDLPEVASRCLAEVRTSGAPMFFLGMLVLPLFGFPLAPFIFTAGPLFGPTMGLPAVIGCSIGAVAGNVALAYWFAVRALRPGLERLIIWLGYPVPNLEKANSWEFTLLLRLLPGVPFFVQSYLLGLARVRIGIYLLISIAVPSGYILAAVIAGDALVQHNRTQLLLAGVVFAVIGLALHLLRRRFAALKQSRQNAA